MTSPPDERGSLVAGGGIIVLHLQAVPPTDSATPGTVGIARDFADPLLELIRLLREASEIEHALMVQYLYSMFSVSTAYPKLRGFALASPKHLFGVAIQEMQHLEKVNRLLADLGAAPNLIRQDFPYEPDIYPFPFTLEPLSPATLAKYVYAEAPTNALDRTDPANQTPEAVAFLDALDPWLTGQRFNHVGSLYRDIIDTTRSLIAADLPGIADLSEWPDELTAILDEGEHGHFEFFKSVFLGTHQGFHGVHDPWSLAPTDPAYPSVPLGANPSAVPGHPRELPDDHGQRRLAWLADLHYWLVLMLLDVSYRTGAPEPGGQAQQHMVSALLPLGDALAALGAGMPFDPLSMGYAPGHDLPGNLRVLRALIHETDTVTAALTDLLPGDLDTSLTAQTLAVVDALESSPTTPPTSTPPTSTPPTSIPPAPSAAHTLAADDAGSGPPTGGDPSMTDEQIMQFWFDFDDAFHFNPSDDVLTAYAALGPSFDVLYAPFHAALATATFEESFTDAVAPKRDALQSLSTLQLAVIDQHLTTEADAQRAFEHFGCGDLYDDRRPPNDKVHMMDISGTTPPIGYRRWHVITRAMIVLGIDAAKWTDLDRCIALAWAIHSEAHPKQDTHNPQLPEERLSALRSRWLTADLATIDAAVAAALVAPATA